ncbi:hypothetical protein ACL2XO_03210 [Sodalis sp. RH15]|uniref:hypothetical protein n=1 Tax=Sodalis sp. RH15 TaxID=3394330 RepID=UPI0039B4D3D9
MADAHHKSEPVISQALRRSVVGYAPDAYRYPQVKLKGKWLEQVIQGLALKEKLAEGSRAG